MKKQLLYSLFIILSISALSFGQTTVASGDGTLSAAIASASDGDVLVLDNAGVYTETQDTTMLIDKNITIKAASGATAMPKIMMHCYAAGTGNHADMFLLKSGAGLTLDGVELDGGLADTSQYSAAGSLITFDVTASNYDVNYLKIANCKLGSTNSKIVNGGNSDASGITLDTLEVTNSLLYDASNALNFKYVGLGYFDVENCSFWNITAGYAVRVQSTDPSIANVIHCTFNNVGPNKGIIQVKKTNDTAVWTVKDCIFSNMPDLTQHAVILTGSSAVLSYCDFWNAGDYDALDGASASDTMSVDPMYKDTANADFTLSACSPLLGAGDDGLAIGDLRWASNATAVNEQSSRLPDSYNLFQNYPNPFNPSTQITFDLRKAGATSLIVYNTLGQKAAVLVNSYMAAGNHTVNFTAANLSSGVYIYVLRVNGKLLRKKMMLLK